MKIIFKGIVGSQAYGTNIPTSDIDIKGVYIQELKDVVGFGYKEQINISKDESYYEVKRFLELAMTGNPTVLELMFLPQHCVLEETEEWKEIKQHARMFLTKKLKYSFSGYALEQIKKAKGLNKKMNWEKERFQRKNVIDFCYCNIDGKTVPLTKYLADNDHKPKFMGMVKLDHMADCYAMYHDAVAQWGEDANHRFKNEAGEVPDLGFKGVESKDGNQLMLSSVPKYIKPEPTTVYFNKSEWAKHIAECASYDEWILNRNTQRYVDSVVHGQKYDGKNLMHCRRLIETAIDIVEKNDLIILRPNREELLAIRRGECRLEDIISDAERDVAKLDALFENSSLPEEVDKDVVEQILIKLRLKGTWQNLISGLRKVKTYLCQAKTWKLLKNSVPVFTK